MDVSSFYASEDYVSSGYCYEPSFRLGRDDIRYSALRTILNRGILVKGDYIDKLQSSFHQWERILPDTGEQVHLTKELLANCESIKWQVDELNKTVDELNKKALIIENLKAGEDGPSLLVLRHCSVNIIVGDVKKSVVARKENGNSASAIRRELMKLPISHQLDRSYQDSAEDNDDFIASESDRQMLLINGSMQQDEELDELSASFERIGGVGLTIHEELLAQEKIIDDLGTEMDSTTNRLDFVQKKVAMVMKKASAKG
ncbi:hypothetical protein GOBAR_AA37432 [Gossypium barbadense]|uniref:t-SNARE coiled-coil homology domain-containing protein n=1 Tax=Gossypium barbadense TaxID=3634 RepID=A0A2P5VWQ5_GOSBA|nr:hypothetical protein GOBAR_AA37432 [Gossypium barbadense]